MVNSDMAKTAAAQRKAEEANRKSQQGLKRRSYWLNEESIETIENYKTANNLKSNDDAINQLLKAR